MPKEVDVDGVGVLEFPDEMTSEEIHGALLHQFPPKQPAFDPSDPFKGSKAEIPADYKSPPPGATGTDRGVMQSAQWQPQPKPMSPDDVRGHMLDRIAFDEAAKRVTGDVNPRIFKKSEYEDYANAVAGRMGARSTPEFTENLAQHLNTYETAKRIQLNGAGREAFGLEPSNDSVTEALTRLSAVDPAHAKEGIVSRTGQLAAQKIGDVGESFAKATMGGLSDQEKYAQKLERIRRAADPLVLPDQGFVSRNLMGLTAMLPQIAGAVATGPAGPALFFGVPSGVETKERSEEAGAGKLQSTLAGVASGTFDTFLFSKFPGRIASQFGGKQVVSDALNQAALKYIWETEKTTGVLSVSGLKSELLKQAALAGSGKDTEVTKTLMDSVRNLPDTAFQALLLHSPGYASDVIGRAKNGMVDKSDAPDLNREQRKSMYEELTKAQSQPPPAAPAEVPPAQPPEQPNVPQEENVQQATEPQAGEELGQGQPAGPETGKEDVGQQADEKPAAVTKPLMPPLGSKAAPQVQKKMLDLGEGDAPGQQVLFNKEGSEPERPYQPGDPLPPGTAASVLPIPPGVQRDLNVFAAGVGKVAKSLRETFSPTGVSEESKGMAGIVRENASELAKRHQQAKAALDKFGRGLMKMPLQARYDFIDGVETGSSQPTPELDDAATAMRTLLDDARERIRDLGTGKLDNFIQDYFPHIWKDPAKAEQVFGVGKRPLEGSKAFLKERTIPTTKEGLAKGLEPVSDNPVDLVLLKLHEMNRYEMAQKILQEGKDVGYIKLARTPGSQPEGWVKINDKIGTVWQRKPTVKADGTEGAPEFVHRGDYYAHPDAGRILNNYLSPGLRGNSAYDAIRFAGNAMNMSQLGMSFFHLTGTTINAIVSRTALAAKLAVEGKPLAAVKMAANAWTAPFSTILGGSKVLAEALKPGSQGSDFAQVVDALQAGGGRYGQDDIYRLGKEATTHWEGFMKALKEGRPSMVPQAFLAAIEQSARPMMEVYIPRMKLGVMLDMARYELEKMPAGATRADVREAMRGAVDSVDNRLGQLVYDNLFWNKTLKDVLMVSTRSLGWNVGTVRELAGGAKDLAKIPLALLRGKRPELTHAASYTLALPFVAGILGSAMAYMYTGHGPQSLMDMYHVPTGNGDDKVQLPTYMRDVFSWATHPGKTLISKTHPLLAATVQMLQNKDFYNRPITNPDDPLIAQAEELGKYVLSQFLPFSIRNAEERKGKKGQPASTPTMQQRVETLIGITPVPKDPKPTKKQLVH